MITIREYFQSDWEMVLGWWNAAKEVPPEEDMMPIGSSFIAEINGVPALAVALYLTNTKAVAYTENFIGNPEVKGGIRKEASLALSDHIFEFAKSLGFKRLMCMTEKSILVNRYIELGYQPTLSGVTTFIRSA